MMKSESALYNLVINRNMGCIEMRFCIPNRKQSIKINRNMGCIEICLVYPVLTLRSLINRNMGCIEIVEYVTELPSQSRLIETWDVLK